MKTIKNITLAIVLLASGVTAAQTLTYNFGDPITNSVVPYGSEPWFVIQLSQMNNYTKVTMTSNLTDGEFISKVGFNLNSNIDYGSLVFTPSDVIGNYTTPTFTVGNDTFNAGAGNQFDLLVQFATRSSDRFNITDSFTFNINTPITTFTNDTLQLPSIVHIQGIGSDNSKSTWLVQTTPTIPEPSSVLLGGLGLILRRRNRHV